jgi:hypothetical protein
MITDARLAAPHRTSLDWHSTVNELPLHRDRAPGWPTGVIWLALVAAVLLGAIIIGAFHHG